MVAVPIYAGALDSEVRRFFSFALTNPVRTRQSGHFCGTSTIRTMVFYLSYDILLEMSYLCPCYNLLKT